MSAAGIRHENKESKTGKMKKRLFAIPLALGMALGMAGCGSSSETTTKVETTTTETTTIAPTTTSTPKTYTIKVYDIDGEVIGDKTVDLNECPTVNDALDKYFDVKKSGTFITSINNSVVDSNWYLSILENGEYSMTGVDGLEANDGDVFEFKSECFNTVAFGGSFDEYDVLVDKAIYHYAKNGLKTSLAASNSFLDSSYWQAMAVYLMENNGYDSNLFNNTLFTDAYKASLSGVDFTDMPNLTEYPTDGNYAKWYYAARLFDVTNEDFTSNFSAYLEGLTKYRDEYSLPFNLSIAKEMNLDSVVSTELLNTTYRASVEYGTDGYAWELCGLALYNTLSDSDFEPLTLANVEAAVEKGYAAKDTSLSLFLLPLAAAKKNAREFMIEENTDIIKYLFDNHFDSESYQFDMEKAEYDYSSNQIYASLMAYKVQRDKGTGVILFA